MCNKGFSSNSIIRPRSYFGIGGLEISTQSLTAHSLDRWQQFQSLNTLFIIKINPSVYYE
jgi:hypothetical protein